VRALAASYQSRTVLVARLSEELVPLVILSLERFVSGSTQDSRGLRLDHDNLNSPRSLLRLCLLQAVLAVWPPSPFAVHIWSIPIETHPCPMPIDDEERPPGRIAGKLNPQVWACTQL
jgi:hypothetical protein